MKFLYRVLTGIVLISGMSSCGEGEPVASSFDKGAGPRVNTPFTPDISINEVMVAQIDHAAHSIWNAANPETTLTDLDWQEVEHHAIQLISSRSAMTMGGTGVNDAMWIAQSSWRDYVNSMNEAGLIALSSARQQDRAALSRAGDSLIETCEGCHQQFKPSIPTEGFTHQH